jgi:leader peptidase (prepilin peptidase)/N-methyltransferase
MVVLWGLVGTLVGGLLNVLITRLPLRGGLWAAPLRCHHCREPLAVWDTLPVLGYLAQRGRCRLCGAPLSPRFLIVELATTLLFGLAFLRFGATSALFIYSFYLTLLVLIFAIDWQHRLILNVVTFPAAALALALSTVAPGTSLLSSLLGAAAYGGSFVLLYLLAVVLYRRGDALGQGDVKLAIVIGLMLGLPRALVALMLGVLLGALAAIAALLAGRGGKEAMPYGTSLSAAAMVAVLYGDLIVNWYLYSDASAR